MAAPPDAPGFAGVHVRLLTRRVCLATALLAAGPSSGLAQQRAEPRLVLTAFGGVAGGRHLWSVSRQPLFVLDTESSPRYDTISLSRNINPGLVVGIAGTFFPTPAIGLSGEIVFLGLSTDDQCRMIHNSGADALQRNLSLCGDIDARSVSPSTVGFFLGATWRAFPRGFASPYVRAQAGIGTRNGSTIQTEGSFLDAGAVLRRRAVILEAASAAPLPSVGAAIGFMVPLAAGHQARLEIRDQMLPLKRVSGIANALGTAATSTVLVHSIALTAGIDIVLEQKRGRRY